jgi:hypothetical protein
MSRYITVGFDTDAAAEKFKALVKKMGHLIKLGETYQSELGEKKLRIHNIQARGIFNTYVPPGMQRIHDVAGVIVEFKDPRDAQVFAIAVMSFAQGNMPTADISDHITALIATVQDDKVVGVRLEKE